MTKVKPSFLAILNFFSSTRFFSVWGIVLLGCVSEAASIHALYTAACTREVGIILGVTNRQIRLLNLQGQIKSIDRFEVIYFASYPLDIVPIRKVSNPSEAPLAEIKTLQGREMVTLVKGWPVDFSLNKISLLTLRGTEVAIDRSSIWKIDFSRHTEALDFTSNSGSDLDFIHPYAFSDCPGDGRKAIRVAPQQILSEPVAIKKEFDRLAQGHESLAVYDRDQQFYPRPEIYKNQTSLGVWLSSGSRYGASNHRKNNFTPILSNEYSSGPFGFQSQFLSGSAPLAMAVHEEPQTQIFYRFKADYFHLSSFFDPALVLVGTKYNWTPDDLASADARMNDTGYLEIGFDYGKLALEMFLVGGVSAGARLDTLFDKSTVNLSRYGLRYTGYHWWGQVTLGSTEDKNYKISLSRVVWEYEPNDDLRVQLLFLSRTLNFDSRRLTDPDKPKFIVETQSTTGAVYVWKKWLKRYWLGGYASVESFRKSSGVTTANDNESKLFPKLGTSISLTF